MKRECGDYLQDIIDAMNKISNFINGISYDDFVEDDKTFFAVVRALEIVGEAVKNIPAALKKKYPAIPWKEMAGMRDKVIHEYFGVDPKIVWRTAKQRIPVIQPLFKNILAELEGQKNPPSS